MFRTSYVREVRKEKYEREEAEDSEPPSAAAAASAQAWESLQDLNGRFARYIGRARVLEQRNAVYRKQLETLQRMEEAGGPEDAFAQQVEFNTQRIRELQADHGRLERDMRDAGRTLDEQSKRYKELCDNEQQLRGTLENLNKEADSALLRNLEYQIQTQFLQDEIDSTRETNKKTLAELETYVNILQQLNETLPLVPSVSLGISEGQQKLQAQREVPDLKRQLEEYKSALCQLNAQKQRLQSETAVLEHAIKTAQENYGDEIQMCNEKIESLRKEIEEAERSLEKCLNECRHLAVYQTSLENELERYKRIIECEDNRLNSAILGSPIALYHTDYRYNPVPCALSRGRDITQAFQDITNMKPRQKILARKVLRKTDLSPRDAMDSKASKELLDAGAKEVAWEERVKRAENRPVFGGVSSQDVPDGAQLSKAFDTLCNIVLDRMRSYQRPEPIADFYTKGRYVLVSGESSYQDPCFYTSTPSAGHIFVTICNGMVSPYDPYEPYSPPEPVKDPEPVAPTPPPPGPPGKDDNKGGRGGKGRNKSGEPPPKPKDPGPTPPAPAPGPKEPQPAPKRPTSPKPKDNSEHPVVSPRGITINSDPSSTSDSASGFGSTSGHGSGPTSGSGPAFGSASGPSPTSGSGPASASGSGNFTPESKSYERVETIESVGMFSKSGKAEAYEETSTVVETTIEKSNKKKI